MAGSLGLRKVSIYSTCENISTARRHSQAVSLGQSSSGIRQKASLPSQNEHLLSLFVSLKLEIMYIFKTGNAKIQKGKSPNFSILNVRFPQTQNICQIFSASHGHSGLTSRSREN